VLCLCHFTLTPLAQMASKEESLLHVLPVLTRSGMWCEPLQDAWNVRPERSG